MRAGKDAKNNARERWLIRAAGRCCWCFRLASALHTVAGSGKSKGPPYSSHHPHHPHHHHPSFASSYPAFFTTYSSSTLLARAVLIFLFLFFSLCYYFFFVFLSIFIFSFPPSLPVSLCVCLLSFWFLLQHSPQSHPHSHPQTYIPCLISFTTETHSLSSTISTSRPRLASSSFSSRCVHCIPSPVEQCCAPASPPSPALSRSVRLHTTSPPVSHANAISPLQSPPRSTPRSLSSVPPSSSSP